MGKSLSELGFTNEQVGQDVKYDDLPTFGGMRPLLPLGSYRFRLPGRAVLETAFDKIAKTEARGERLNIVFDENAPLVIVQAPAALAHLVGQPYETRVWNVERSIGRSGIEASELDYLLRACGVKEKPKTNTAYAQALLGVSGKEFTADARWSWKCSQWRAAYFDDGQGGTTPQYAEGANEETPEEQRYTKGCGVRAYIGRGVTPAGEEPILTEQNGLYYVSKSVDGTVPERITCPNCGASVRAFDGLENFRA